MDAADVTGRRRSLGYEVTALLMSSTAPNATVLGTRPSRCSAPTIRSKAFTLTPGTYRFEVVALNAIGFSPASAMSNAVAAR